MTETLETPRPGRLERRKARTRAAIIEAASSLFHAQGYDSTPIQQIAERADVGVGTLYGYFDSKEQILREVLRVHSAEALAHYNAVIRPDTPPIERVITGLATLADYVREHRAVLLAAFQVAGRMRQIQPDEEEDWLVGVFRTMIEEGVARGGFSPVPADATARMLVGAYLQAMLHIGVWEARRDVDQSLADLELLTRQLLTRHD